MSRRSRGSLTKQPDNFYQPRETFNPNDYEKLRINQSIDNQIVEKEPPQQVDYEPPKTDYEPPRVLRSKFPTEEELAQLDKNDLERLMEERMDMIMAQ